MSELSLNSGEGRRIRVHQYGLFGHTNIRVMCMNVFYSVSRLDHEY